MSRPLTGPRPRTRRYVRCAICDKAITYNNLSTHLQVKHPERAGEPRKSLYAEIAEPPARVAAPPKPAPELPPLGIDDLDSITLTVVGQLAEPAGLIPVAYLPAVFAWREATAAFLRSVSER